MRASPSPSPPRLAPAACSRVLRGPGDETGEAIDLAGEPGLGTKAGIPPRSIENGARIELDIAVYPASSSVVCPIAQKSYAQMYQIVLFKKLLNSVDVFLVSARPASCFTDR